jgi:HAD superfamily hydrolase (TIGR01509 family)
LVTTGAVSFPGHPTPAVRSVVWDMDGTLIDSSVAVPDAFVRTVDLLRGPPCDRSAVVAAYSLGPPEVILGHLLGRDLRPGEEELYYEQLVAVRVRPYPLIPEALAWSGRFGNVAVFTGASTRAARLLLATAELIDLVQVIVGGDEIAAPKPAPDGVVEAARRLNVDPAHVAYVGDAPADLGAARAAGAVAAAATWGHLYDPEAECDVRLATPMDVRTLLLNGGA